MNKDEANKIVTFEKAYEEIKQVEDICRKILDKCKASKEDIEQIYRNANDVFFEVIDEFYDIGIVYALQFSLMREVTDYIRERFNKDCYMQDNDIFIDGVNAVEYEFFKE